MTQTIIDVSKYQYDIDWPKVKGNTDRVLIRIGYRGYGSAGNIVRDGYEDKNIQGCIDNDIPYGVYFFSQAVNYDEGVREAEYTLNKLKGFKVQPLLPVFIDTEWANGRHNGRADNISVESRTQAIKGFCETIEKAGYWAGVYASTSWFYSMVKDTELSRYTHWVADYRGYCGYNGAYSIWQYSSGANIPGINGRVDINIGYIDFATIVKEQGLNGYQRPMIPVTGGEKKIQAISEQPIRLCIGYRSSGDIATLAKVIEGLEIPYEVNEGFIYTRMASKGDQVTIIAKADNLGIAVKEYAEVTVIAETTKDYAEKPQEDAGSGVSVVIPPEEKATEGLFTLIIRWLLKLLFKE